MTAHGLDRSRLVAICPGAEFGPAKQWPIDHFSDLVTRLIDDGYQIVLLGSPNDADDIQRLINQIEKSKRKGLVNLAGLTSIPEAVDVIGDAVGTNIPALTRLGLGNTPTRLDLSPGKLHFKRFTFYPKAVSDQQLINLSTP